MEEKKKETRWWDLCFFLISLNFYSLRSYTSEAIFVLVFSYRGCLLDFAQCPAKKKAKLLNAMKNIRWDRRTGKEPYVSPLFFLYLGWPEEVMWRIKKAYTHLAGWFVCVWYYPTQQRVLYFYEFYTRRWWRQCNPSSTRHSSSYNIFSSLFP